jgi:hypothetical protein
MVGKCRTGSILTFIKTTHEYSADATVDAASIQSIAGSRRGCEFIPIALDVLQDQCQRQAQSFGEPFFVAAFGELHASFRAARFFFHLYFHTYSPQFPVNVDELRRT